MAFSRLAHHMFLNCSLTRSTKVAVYKVICLSILLPVYGCESWIPYRRHVKALEAHHIRFLQSILGIRWWHRKTHSEIRGMTNIESVEYLLLQRQLCWLGLVIRVPSKQLPRRLLYGELLLGQRPVGRPKLRYSDVKPVLRKCNIPEAVLEELAADREQWSYTHATGLKSFKASSEEQVASDCRACRHSAAVATPAGPVCRHCDRISTSYFGLGSHIRICLWPHNWHYISATWLSKSQKLILKNWQLTKQTTKTVSVSTFIFWPSCVNYCYSAWSLW